MGKNNEALLRIAESYLGMGGSVFRKFCGLPSNAAWCNAFVDFVAYKGNDAKLYFDGKKMTYCPTSIQWCYKNLAEIPPYLAMPMDIIYFDWEKNGVPNHIGFVRRRKDCDSIYTIEGNTSGGKVANRERPVKYVQAIFRPAFEGKFDTSKKLEIDGFFGYNSIAMLQRVLMITQDGILGQKTVKALQRFVGVTADGSWGTKTSKAVQKLVGVKQDGKFGPASVKALQKWLNKQAFTIGQTTKPVVLTKIEKAAKALAWPEGTPKKKYAWKGGRATKTCKEDLDKYYPSHDNWSKAPSKACSCDVFAGLSVRKSGLDKHFPRGFDEQWKHKPSDKMVKLTFKNVSPYSVSKPGDVVLYHKNKKGTSKHVVTVGRDKNGKKILREAQYAKTYGHVNKSCSKIKKKRPKVVIFRAK